MPSEELVLRARLDVEAGRAREAALQARIALEALLADLRGVEGRSSRLEELLGELGDDRAVVGEAANAALEGEPGEALERAVADAVQRMDQALRHARRST
jgi:HEPN domain-containing protein